MPRRGGSMDVRTCEYWPIIIVYTRLVGCVTKRRRVVSRMDPSIHVCLTNKWDLRGVSVSEMTKKKKKETISISNREKFINLSISETTAYSYRYSLSPTSSKTNAYLLLKKKKRLQNIYR